MQSPFLCHRFSYIGIQPPPGSRFDVVKAESGEHESLRTKVSLKLRYSISHERRKGRDVRKMQTLDVHGETWQPRAAKLFQSDPYGCHSQTLVEKRRARNPLPELQKTFSLRASLACELQLNEGFVRQRCCPGSSEQRPTCCRATCLDMQMKGKGLHPVPQAVHKPEATKKQRGPELKALLQWCGPDIFRGALPWGSQTEPEKEKSS